MNQNSPDHIGSLPSATGGFVTEAVRASVDIDQSLLDRFDQGLAPSGSPGPFASWKERGRRPWASGAASVKIGPALLDRGPTRQSAGVVLPQTDRSADGFSDRRE